MARKKDYDEVLDQARDLIRDAEGGEDFALEDILAEYGGGRQRLLQELEQTVVPQKAEKPAPEPERTADTRPLPQLKAEEPPAPEPEKKQPEEQKKRPGKVVRLPVRWNEPKPEPEPGPELEPAPEPEIPPPPKPLSMEEMVGQTVDAVMEERENPRERRSRKGLFTRRPMPDTEELYPDPDKDVPEEENEEPIGPEMPLEEAATRAGRLAKQRRESLPAALILTLALAVAEGAEMRGIQIPLWSEDVVAQTAILLGLLALVCLCCRSVFAYGAAMLARRRCCAEQVTALAAVVTALDCGARILSDGRSGVMPYALPVCAALTFAQWGLARRERGMYDAYRAAAITREPPYLVTDAPQGACKEPGCLRGFYDDSVKDDLSLKWQTALVPVILMGTLVFGGLTSLGKGNGSDFLLCWSATLAAASSLALPLAWSLPWSRLAGQLQKSGCALAGWAGAAAISRKKKLVLSDLDLFPPGAVRVNGIKVYGEKVPHAVSYAATLIRASHSGLERLFDDLLRSEGGSYRQLSDFSYYEEGGCSAVIKGESVLLGTASFMRKMEVRLPGNLNLHTGLYLAVDRQLVAVFAVKYTAAENVDWALRMLRRNHITPILAARDPNVTPALLKRKFGRGVRMEHPAMAVRLALSEQEGGRPRALLLREGLLPYAETVVGSRRLRQGVRWATVVSLLGSAAGTLLAYYLCSVGALSMMPPLTLLAFQLLWVVPVALLADWTARY